NARDAMPDGGSLEIRTSLGHFPGRRGERAIVIALHDSGAGVPADILPHVFEPFYTTKGGHGSGLGLSQVYGFARASGGEVTMTSEIGRGTTVTIYLPVATSAALPSPSSKASDHHQGDKAAAVLIVDDNDDVRA